MMPDRWTRRALLMLAALAVTMSGCTTYVTSQVTAFSAWNGGSDATRTYAFTRNPTQEHSIEQSTYENLVADGLDVQAFHQVPEPQARYLVGLAYGSRMDTVTVAQPVFYNPWPSPYWGPFNPWGPWGPYGPAYVNQSYPVYSHALSIRITEKGSGKEVYNVSARTSGDDPSLVRVMPYLVRSALANFPLQNGTVTQVKLPLDKQGGAPNEAAAPVPASAPGNAQAK
ncbi:MULTISPECIES: DUF4136 domain-containing protein [Paraburkholderia]|uniref:Uncharacterized protein DUF4136 n=1 Tax=Paraburkholderia tropica TaxID=92647 RepID=A0A1A5XK90_9BURK|nr:MULTISPECIES: DUF4136 domain-containing protein [Paraburkholderia]MBB2979332.1 hypothetical protein [Paraburkholderia tropica]MBB3001874.1 hypothetical protein [Paraburkholderia tropica]MBB6321257.1 hypothetical protein [Paraburkholderia tropica]MDE1143143.1 DUF4136 domain-containing protein [Paraburkholderia tropica]OBR53754.1 transmembrane lipoprotein [Paraburkholderia tropica]